MLQNKEGAKMVTRTGSVGSFLLGAPKGIYRTFKLMLLDGATFVNEHERLRNLKESNLKKASWCNTATITSNAARV